MVIFAMRDWAAGNAMQRLLTNLAIVLAISTIAIMLGIRLLRSASSAGSKCLGGLLLLLSCLLPLIFNFTNPQATRPDNGAHALENYPGNKIKEGMSLDEVQAILGPPHQRKRNNDRETWIYWTDSYGGTWVGIDFGPNGRVTKMYGN